MTLPCPGWRPAGLAFFSRPTPLVAAELIGAVFQQDQVWLQLTEVEAYGGPEDSASHARFGPTTRNQVMFGEPGRLYVYLCYGIHQMVNLIAHPPGAAGGVLVRSARVLAGEDVVRTRRGNLDLAGPGKVGAALGAHGAWTGQSVGSPLQLWLADALPVRFGPRVGINFASPEDIERPWRFAAAEFKVSAEKTLGPRSVSRGTGPVKRVVDGAARPRRARR